MSRLLSQKRVGVIALILASFLIAACQTEVRETFDLQQARVVAKANSSPRMSILKTIQILIPPPSALKVFDGEAIVIDREGSLSYLKGAQFGDRLPNMLQARLSQAFEDTGLLGGVSRPGEGLAIHYQILSDIRSFSVKLREDGARAHIEIGIKILDDKTGQVRASRIFEVSDILSGSDNRALIQGLERTLARLLVQIVNWSFDYL